MKTTPSHALRKFVAGIHPQLPLDAREAQRLLTVLNSTFRKQLDEQHPPAPLPSESAAKPLRRIKPISFEGYKAPQNISSHISASDHLESILANPLFAPGPRDASSSQGRTNQVHAAVQTFRTLAASGAADLIAADRCLGAVLQESCKERIKPPKPIKSMVGNSFAGSEVLAWLRSSGTFDSPGFQKDSKFLRALIGCLVAEGLQANVEAWLSSNTALASSKPGATTDNVDWHKGIVSGLVHAMLLFREGVDKTVQLFLRCLDTHQRHLPRSENGTCKDTYSIFQPAGFRLTKILSTPHLRKYVTVAAHNTWMAEVPRWMGSPALTVARLHLHHPAHPDAAPAMNYLQSLDASEAAQCEPKTRQQLFGMCLDAADVLIAQQKRKEGAWVIDYAKRILPASEAPTDSELSSRFSVAIKRQEEYNAASWAFG